MSAWTAVAGRMVPTKLRRLMGGIPRLVRDALRRHQAEAAAVAHDLARDNEQAGPDLWTPTDDDGSRKLVLFICGGNTLRSPMAAALAGAELARRDRTAEPIVVESAGMHVAVPGAPMDPSAAAALRALGVAPPVHRARMLTRELAEQSALAYCMTHAQHDAVLALAPATIGRTFCIDPNGDVAEPIGDSPEFYRQFALRLQYLVRQRFAETALTRVG